MKFRFNLVYSLFPLIFSTALSQYSSGDTGLIRTTVTREYDKKIVLDYLNSGDLQKVSAALLSIANSGDTAFIPYLLNDRIFNSNRRGLLFALSLLGPSASSSEFINRKLNTGLTDRENRQLINALGYTGNLSDLNNIFTAQPGYGISEALLNFHIRGLRSSRTKEVIIKEILSGDDTISISALYSLNRMGLSKDLLPEIERIFRNELNEGRFNSEKSYYCLMAFRRAKYFPLTPGQTNSLIENADFDHKAELGRAVIFSKFSTEDDYKIIFDLLKDKNENVGVSVATAISDLKPDNPEHRDFLFHRLKRIITTPDIHEQVKGYLFVSLCSLFPDSVVTLRKKFRENILPKYYFRSFSVSDRTNRDELSALLRNINNSGAASEIEIALSIASKRSQWKSILNYDSLLLGNFSAKVSPAALATLCENIDTQFVLENARGLGEGLLIFIGDKKDDYETSVAYPNILRVLEIAGKEYKLRAESLISASKVTTLEGVLPRKPGMRAPRIKQTALFDELLSKSFSFKEAEMITTKGTIKFRLLPEFAPLTVGNFIYLSQKGFYNGVTFHRVVPGFVIQSGDTANTGWYGPGYQIVSEFSYLPFNEGTAGIASNGPDTEGSQWFFMQKDFPHLNGRYTVWGELIEGIDVIRSITESDSIKKIEFK